MGKFGKWIGGGLGWALGGPIGGLLGFVLGSVVDNLKKPSYKLFNFLLLYISSI